MGAKLAIGVFAVVAVASALAFVEFTRREQASLRGAKRVAASMVADLLAASLAAPLDFSDQEGIDAELGHLKDNHEVVYAAVWQPGQGKPVAELEAAGVPPPAVPGARDKARTTIAGDRVEAVRPVVGRGGKAVGSVVVHFSLAAEEAAFAASRVRMFWLCVALGLGTVGLLLGLARRQIVRPLEELLEAARHMERGGSDARVTVRANDEIGRVAAAFNAMSAAIEDREQRLAAATHSVSELLDHMRQAIVVFGADGLARKTHSRKAREVFGVESLEGRRVQELLYGDAAWSAEAQAFAEWRDLAFQVDEAAWPEVEALAPREAVLEAAAERGAHAQVLSLEFRPIFEGGLVTRIMMLATDETERRRLERQVEEQGEHHARQLAAMRRLVTGGGQLFVSFVERARARIARCLELCGPDAARTSLTLEDVSELFRHVHTLKGEAKSFEVGDLAVLMSGIEERLVELRAEAREQGTADVAPLQAELTRGLRSGSDAIAEAEAMFIEASPIGRAGLEQVTVRRPDVERLCQLLDGRSDELGRLATRFASRPFGEIVAQLADRIPAWAEAESKRARVEVEGREVLVPRALAQAVGGALTHLVRNAVAHGIESEAERERSGKPTVGLVRVRCEDVEQNGASGDRPMHAGPTLFVEDDGRGVGASEALQRASRAGEPLGIAQDVASRGTGKSDLAGRGVGLAAATAELAAVGYALYVESKEGRGACFSIRPAAAVLDRVSTTSA